MEYIYIYRFALQHAGASARHASANTSTTDRDLATLPPTHVTQPTGEPKAEG